MSKPKLLTAEQVYTMATNLEITPHLPTSPQDVLALIDTLRDTWKQRDEWKQYATEQHDTRAAVADKLAHEQLCRAGLEQRVKELEARPPGEQRYDST